MWIITIFLKENIKMYEFNTREEANEALKNINGYKILSQIVYYNDPYFV
ncbi:hypothetical protein ACIQ34_19805 [Ureibacillus sp. NPDC094379]